MEKLFILTFMAIICGFQISSVGAAISAVTVSKKDLGYLGGYTWPYCSSHSHCLFDIVLHCLYRDLPRKFKTFLLEPGETLFEPLLLDLLHCISFSL